MKLKNKIIGLLGAALFSSAVVNAESLFSWDNHSIVSENVKQSSISEVERLKSNDQSIKNSFIYNTNPGALSADTDKLTLNLTPDIAIEFNKSEASEGASGSLVWQGNSYVKGTNNGLTSESELISNNAILVLREGRVTGTVRVDGRLFKIQPLASGQHLVIEVDENNMQPDHPPGEMEQMESEIDAEPENGSVESEMNHAESEVGYDEYASFAPEAGIGQLAAASTPVVRVLVLYSNGVPAEVDDIPAMVDLAIAETNRGFINSHINLEVEMAHLSSINYDAVGVAKDLPRLKSTDDGYMDYAHTLRNKYSADVVMLLTPKEQYCGKAAAIGASSASSGFAVTAQNCATGYYSFGHELGHLFGARHNPEKDSKTTPFAYGHGYQDTKKKWRTIMAYNCSPSCSRINWWSNPYQRRNGRAMGTTSKSNNARALAKTAAKIAAFRGDPIVNVIKNGAPWSGISNYTKGTDYFYKIDVPYGAKDIKFEMSGGTGDADLYVKFKTPSTNTSWDCRPYKEGNNETCDMTSTRGTYYIRINAYSEFSDVTLKASYTGGVDTVGADVKNISVSKGKWLRYTYKLPVGLASMTVSIAGKNGDADLYVTKAAKSTGSIFDCRPYRTGSNESCTFNYPASGTWYLDIYGAEAATGVTLKVETTK
ncbi:pre-peptidase C-terminal domain-containing protein [Aliikangiella sp. IMCC44359]|uniref:pre-peptidase C-terminal domain-containing protein n=1 Tax=Aliikangiella sp. IMCC44359 TaxID=3459125 RepID=UPI00403A85CC